MRIDSLSVQRREKVIFSPCEVNGSSPFNEPIPFQSETKRNCTFLSVHMYYREYLVKWRLFGCVAGDQAENFHSILLPVSNFLLLLSKSV